MLFIYKKDLNNNDLSNICFLKMIHYKNSTISISVNKWFTYLCN